MIIFDTTCQECGVIAQALTAETVCYLARVHEYNNPNHTTSIGYRAE